jgi:hypothetical protein
VPCAQNDMQCCLGHGSEAKPPPGLPQPSAPLLLQIDHDEPGRRLDPAAIVAASLELHSNGMIAGNREIIGYQITVAKDLVNISRGIQPRSYTTIMLLPGLCPQLDVVIMTKKRPSRIQFERPTNPPGSKVVVQSNLPLPPLTSTRCAGPQSGSRLIGTRTARNPPTGAVKVVRRQSGSRTGRRAQISGRSSRSATVGGASRSHRIGVDGTNTKRSHGPI